MKTPGQIAYEAYCEFAQGVSLVSAQPLPIWTEQSERIRPAWEAAAKAVIEAHGNGQTD